MLEPKSKLDEPSVTTKDRPRRAEEGMSLFLQNRYLIIAFASLLCFVVAQLITFYIAGYIAGLKIVAGMLNEVAFALVIALGISFGIETSSRRELQFTIRSELENHEHRLADINCQLTETVDKIGRDVFLAVFKRHLPGEILDEVELGIMRSDFARTDHSAVYHLETVDLSKSDPNAPRPKAMLVEVTTTYRVKNIADGSRSYDIKILVTKDVSADLVKYTRIEEVRVDDDPPLDRAKAKIEDTETYQRFTYTVDAVPPGNAIQVRSKISYIKSLDDCEIWTSAVASDGMQLTIDLPSDVKEWNAYSIHRLPLQIVTKEPTFGVLQLNHAILPHQGMAVWWRCSH
jgi:hypothetical protein